MNYFQHLRSNFLIVSARKVDVLSEFFACLDKFNLILRQIGVLERENYFFVKLWMLADDCVPLCRHAARLKVIVELKVLEN